MPAIIITGGPGSGKTTLLQNLQNEGHTVVPEVSRELIRQETAVGSGCLPWLNLECFAKKCLARMIADFETAAGSPLTFFDRGVPDILAYLKVAGLEIPPSFVRASQDFRYAETVFIAPPWEAIYVNDEERWQTFEEAETLYRALRAVYTTQGYEVIELPRAPVAERSAFITNRILHVL